MWTLPSLFQCFCTFYRPVYTVKHTSLQTSLKQTETCRGPRFRCFLQQCQEVPSPECGQYCLRTGIWDPAKPAHVTNSPNSEFLLVAHPGIPAAHRPGLQQQQLSREEIHSLGPKWTHYPHGISSFWASPCKHRSFVQSQEWSHRPRLEFGTVLNRKPSPAAKTTEKAEIKPAKGKLTLKTLARKGLVMFFNRKQIWRYLTKPLTWFLFTPCSSWGCRNMAQQRMDRWTQSVPGYLWGPHCYFLLKNNYPISIFQKGNWGTKTIQHLQELTGHSQLPLKAAAELQPLLKISASISHPQISLLQSQHLIQIQSPPNPCYLEVKALKCWEVRPRNTHLALSPEKELYIH